jgi:hypothetical protein
MKSLLTMRGFQDEIGFLSNHVPFLMEVVKLIDKQLSDGLGKNIHVPHAMTHLSIKGTFLPILSPFVSQPAHFFLFIGVTTLISWHMWRS